MAQVQLDAVCLAHEVVGRGPRAPASDVLRECDRPFDRRLIAAQVHAVVVAAAAADDDALVPWADDQERLTNRGASTAVPGYVDDALVARGRAAAQVQPQPACLLNHTSQTDLGMKDARGHGERWLDLLALFLLVSRSSTSGLIHLIALVVVSILLARSLTQLLAQVAATVTVLDVVAVLVAVLVTVLVTLRSRGRIGDLPFLTQPAVAEKQLVRLLLVVHGPLGPL